MSEHHTHPDPSVRYLIANAEARARREALAPVLALADEWDACDEHGNPLREGSIGEAADELRAVASDPDATRHDAQAKAEALLAFVQWVATNRAFNGSDYRRGQSLYNECINAALPLWAADWLRAHVDALDPATPGDGGAA